MTEPAAVLCAAAFTTIGSTIALIWSTYLQNQGRVKQHRREAFAQVLQTMRVLPPPPDGVRIVTSQDVLAQVVLRGTLVMEVHHEAQKEAVRVNEENRELYRKNLARYSEKVSAAHAALSAAMLLTENFELRVKLSKMLTVAYSGNWQSDYGLGKFAALDDIETRMRSEIGIATLVSHTTPTFDETENETIFPELP